MGRFHSKGGRRSSLVELSSLESLSLRCEYDISDTLRQDRNISFLIVDYRMGVNATPGLLALQASHLLFVRVSYNILQIILGLLCFQLRVSLWQILKDSLSANKRNYKISSYRYALK